MNRSEFISTMKRMSRQYLRREDYLDKIQEFLGMKMIEELYERDFLPILIETLERELNDKGKNITYLIYECHFSLQEMSEKIENYDGSPVILHDYGDLYDFITRDEDMEDDIND